MSGHDDSTLRFFLSRALSQEVHPNYLICAYDDWNNPILIPSHPSSTSDEYLTDIITRLRVKAATKFVSDAVLAILDSPSYIDTDYLTLDNGTKIYFLYSASSHLPADAQAAFLRQERELVLWSNSMDALYKLYKSLRHELCTKVGLKGCSCFLNHDNPPMTSSSSVRNHDTVDFSINTSHPDYTLCEVESPLPVLLELSHLSWGIPDIVYSSHHSGYPDDRRYNSLDDNTITIPGLHELEKHFESSSLLRIPSPLLCSPPSTSSSPQTVCFSDISPRPVEFLPASPSEPEHTPPISSDGSGLEDDIEGEGDRTIRSAPTGTHPLPTVPPYRPQTTSASGPCLFTEPTQSSCFTYPMPEARRPPTAGGKVKSYGESTWRSASATSPRGASTSTNKTRKLAPSISTSSPAENGRRRGRLAPNAAAAATPTTTTPSLASLKISSPSQPQAGPSLHSPTRLGLVSSPKASWVAPGRGAMVSPITPITSGEVGRPGLHADDEDDEYADDGGDYDPHDNKSSLSPKSSSMKPGTKRKKRRSGGAVSQKKQKFACDACGQTFTRDADMRRHQTTACKKATSIESMTCRYCQVPFNRPDALNRHIRTKHRNLLA